MCPRATETGLQVTDLRDKLKKKTKKQKQQQQQLQKKPRCLAFLRLRSLCQGSSGRPTASARDRPIPRDQGRRAQQLRGCQMCGPARSAGRTGPPLPAPPLSLAKWRRRHEAPPPRPAFVPSRPLASHRAPRRAPDTRGLPRSQGSASRHSRRLRPSYLTSNGTDARPERPGELGQGPSLRLPTSRGLPHSSGKEDRAPAAPSVRTAPPRRTPEAAANRNPWRGGVTNPKAASATRARPLNGPGLWEAGASFAAAPTLVPAGWLAVPMPTPLAGRASSPWVRCGRRAPGVQSCARRQGGRSQASCSHLRSRGNRGGVACAARGIRAENVVGRASRCTVPPVCRRPSALKKSFPLVAFHGDLPVPQIVRRCRSPAVGNGTRTCAVRGAGLNLPRQLRDLVPP